MIDRLASMFRIEDLRKKILFTLLVVIIYRVGSFIILPYVDYAAVQTSLKTDNEGLLSYFALLAGGGLRNLALFALGIMPYITASIIMQLLGEIVPKLKAWKDEGQDGQKKTTQLTRYVTIFLALLQASVLVSQLNQGRLFNQRFDQGEGAIKTFLLGDMNTWKFLLMIITLVAGTALIMWLGELITQRGIGNGMSILIFASVASSVPFQFQAIWTEGSRIAFIVIVAIGIGMIAGVVFIESGQRRAGCAA